MKTMLPNMQPWRHDLCGCLHSSIATVLLSYNQDPGIVLGAVWDFYYPPGDARREEYYYPCRWSSLVSSLAPYHPVTSHWHEPVDMDMGWIEVKQAIQEGKPAIVAVDNYHLPFRPAYGDVHSNHLILVYGFDEEANEVYVLDAVPPAFKGAIRMEELCAARSSENIAVHDRDLFFTNSPVANRWFDVEVTGTFPSFTREWVTEVISSNLARFRSPSDGPAFSGLSGMARCLNNLSSRAGGEHGTVALDELFMVGDIIQESTALHADFLMTAGQRLGWYQMTEVGRRVERLAHHCTAIRIMAAKGRSHPAAMAPQLTRRFAHFLRDFEQALEDLEWLLKS